MTTTTKVKASTQSFTRVFLRNQYGPHAWTYLRDYLKVLPRERKQQQKYLWSRTAPTVTKGTSAVACAHAVAP